MSYTRAGAGGLDRQTESPAPTFWPGAHSGEQFAQREENKLSVLMLLPYFPPDYSGAGAQALKLSLALRRCGLSVSVMTTGTSALMRFGQVAGISVIRIPAFGPEWLRTVLFNVGSLPLLLLRMKRFDVIHLHSLNGMYSAMLLKWLAGKKVIFKITNFGMDDPVSLRRQPGGRLKLFFFKRADRVVAISRDCLKSCRQSKVAPGVCAFIPNGVDVELFKPLNREQRARLRRMMAVKEDELVIAFVGQIRRRKGVIKIVRALRPMLAGTRRIRCFIVGPVAETDYFATVQEEIAAQSSGAFFHFTGEVGDARRYLQISDIFVFPSEREGLPNALLEAMACGLACIASNISGCADVITHGKNGLLVDPDSISELTEAIRAVAEDGRLRTRLGRAARRSMCEQYSLDRIAGAYCELYGSVLQRPMSRI
ncbi:MAG: glycosyltransferase family 4 protein [Candidatus Zhuqueibacterota bacterium]